MASDYDAKTCPRKCQEQYSPMCAARADGKTEVFLNECFLSMENCNKAPEQSNQGQALTTISNRRKEKQWRLLNECRRLWFHEKRKIKFQSIAGIHLESLSFATAKIYLFSQDLPEEMIRVFLCSSIILLSIRIMQRVITETIPRLQLFVIISF